MKLYDLPAAFAEWEAKLDLTDGELTPELEAELAELEGTLEQKADAFGALIRSAQAEQETYGAEARHFADKATIARNRAERLKGYVKSVLAACGRDKVKGEKFTLAIQKNSAPAIAVDGRIEDLPPEFQRVTVEADRTAIAAAWKAGAVLPGNIVVEVGTHLRVR